MILLTIFFIIIVIIFLVGMLGLLMADTQTFRAIDERIAGKIRKQ